MKRLALALSLLALPAAAHEVTTETLVIDHPYALETAATAMSGAGYMTITNTGSAPDRLLEVRADFPRVTLHGTQTDAQGVTRMIPVEGIGIAPGETVMLAPGGMHVMFMGLDGDPFEEGERIPATLVFERAGEIAVEFWVEPRDGGMTGHEGHDHGSIAPAHDPVTIAAAQAALRDVLGADTIFGPAALAGNAAVLTWVVAGEAGRAFLRQEAGGWSVILLSGESLRFAATYRVLGLSPRLAAELEATIAFVEADLDASQRAAHDTFAGTLLLVDG
jgi:periplasmic copper chaperone A